MYEYVNAVQEVTPLKYSFYHKLETVFFHLIFIDIMEIKASTVE